jgi:hypothetical protein
MITCQKSGVREIGAQVLREREAALEKIVTQMAIDLKEMIVLDAVVVRSETPEVRIRTHDLHGILPEIIFTSDEDWEETLQRLEAKVAELAAIAHIRMDLAALFPRSCFLLPTLMDGGVVVGLAVPDKTFLIEAPTFCIAYHELKRQATNEC